MSFWVRCSAALALAFSVAGSAQQAGTAPDAQTQTQPVPVIRTQANLVLLDVVVTAKGASVHGLEKASFHVTDNGQPVTPSVFEEHRPGDAPATKAPPDLGPGVYSNLPSYTVGSAANVLLLDSFSTPTTNQTQVREQMLAYLRTVPPGTRIAVFTPASRMRLVQGFTADAGQLAEALRSRDSSRTSVRLLGGQIDKDEAAEFARSGASRSASSGSSRPTTPPSTRTRGYARRLRRSKSSRGTCARCPDARTSSGFQAGFRSRSSLTRP